MLISAQLKKATADSIDAALLTSNINQGKKIHITYAPLDLFTLSQGLKDISGT